MPDRLPGMVMAEGHVGVHVICSLLCLLCWLYSTCLAADEYNTRYHVNDALRRFSIIYWCWAALMYLKSEMDAIITMKAKLRDLERTDSSSPNSVLKTDCQSCADEGNFSTKTMTRSIRAVTSPSWLTSGAVHPVIPAVVAMATVIYVWDATQALRTVLFYYSLYSWTIGALDTIIIVVVPVLLCVVEVSLAVVSLMIVVGLVTVLPPEITEDNLEVLLHSLDGWELNLAIVTA